MNKEIIVTIISIVLSSTAISAVANAYFNRKKTKEEAKVLSITGEATSNAEWIKLFKEIKEDNIQLRAEIIGLKLSFETLKHEKEVFAVATKEKDLKILQLEERIDILEADIEKYKNSEKSIDQVAHIIHNSVDKVVDEVKNTQ